ncbi:NUDIX domain-containing protein [Streptomyces sp. SAJ15]|uniref:NUDIX domain-containing protein n=1 Tax=Streptomyces sp. SAJ15 TaxID=2011095 RepID=UPI0011865045|nr:NUDIX hydrolase [Streptomyces sp. SAJ15]TVL88440.1 NUDIX domain-containing protein [Streptomyces sp. SAJ15]
MTDAQPPAQAVALRTGVSALITNRRGEYLLHLRDDISGICWPGYWAPVGGRPNPGESLDAAIARELQEETGLTIPLTAFTTVDQKNVEQKGLIAIYTGQWDGDAHALPLTEGIMLHFFPTAVMSRLRLPPWCREAIELHQNQ